MPLMEIENYYPKLISRDDFNRLNEGRFKKKGLQKKIQNIFSHIAKCPLCGSSMTTVVRNKYSHYLICVRANNYYGCTRKNINYKLLENAFLDNISEVLSNSKTGSNESVLIKTKLKLLSAARTEPMDKRQINDFLRQLFNRIVVDYLNGKMIFEWNKGGKTEIRYSDLNKHRRSYLRSC